MTRDLPEHGLPRPRCLIRRRGRRAAVLCLRGASRSRRQRRRAGLSRPARRSHRSDIHRVTHAGNTPAVTINAYSPPLWRMGAYQVKDSWRVAEALDLVRRGAPADSGRSRQLAVEHVAQHVHDLLRSLRSRHRGAVDLLEGVGRIGVVERDDRLAECGRETRIKGRVPLLVLVPNRTTTTSAWRISVWVRIALTPAPLWSFQNPSDSSPRIATPTSSEAPWSVTGELKARSRPAFSAPSAIRSRQSEWISPAR